MSSSSPSKPAPAATVALIGLSPECREVLHAAFGQVSIGTFPVEGDLETALENRHFQACVLRLGEHAEQLIHTVRNSILNHSIPILGICPANVAPRNFAQFGLNAIMVEPVQRTDAVKAVHSTHLLILRELRRHVRIPIVLEAQVQITGGAAFTALTHDVSYGGMSVSTQEKIFPDNEVEITFRLPNGSDTSITGTIVWRHHPDLIGVRFAVGDERRGAIRDWMDQYLQSA